MVTKPDPLTRKLRRLFAQPRIPGVCREPRHVSLLPEVHRWLIDRARTEGSSVSAVAAKLVSAARGIDAFTGQKIPRRAVRMGRTRTKV